MKIHIDIREDEELRKAVRAMIESQIKSVAREEIADIVRDYAGILTDSKIIGALERGIKQFISNHTQYDFRQELRAEMKAEVTNRVNAELPTYLKKELPKAVNSAVDIVINRLVKYQGTRE